MVSWSLGVVLLLVILLGAIGWCLVQGSGVISSSSLAPWQDIGFGVRARRDPYRSDVTLVELQSRAIAHTDLENSRLLEVRLGMTGFRDPTGIRGWPVLTLSISGVGLRPLSPPPGPTLAFKGSGEYSATLHREYPAEPVSGGSRQTFDFVFDPQELRTLMDHGPVVMVFGPAQLQPTDDDMEALRAFCKAVAP